MLMSSVITSCRSHATLAVEYHQGVIRRFGSRGSVVLSWERLKIQVDSPTINLSVYTYRACDPNLLCLSVVKTATENSFQICYTPAQVVPSSSLSPNSRPHACLATTNLFSESPRNALQLLVFRKPGSALNKRSHPHLKAQSSITHNSSS